MSDTVEKNQRRSLKENLRETVDILKHSEIGVPKAILITIVVLAECPQTVLKTNVMYQLDWMEDQLD